MRGPFLRAQCAVDFPDCGRQQVEPRRQIEMGVTSPGVGGLGRRTALCLCSPDVVGLLRFHIFPVA